MFWKSVRSRAAYAKYTSKKLFLRECMSSVALCNSTPEGRSLGLTISIIVLGPALASDSASSKVLSRESLIDLDITVGRFKRFGPEN